MRIKITCDVGKGISIPINYNYFLSSVIYSFLELSDPEYAYFLHEDGYLLGDKHFKLFTFSQLMAKRRSISGERISFNSPLTWYVSSPQEEFLGRFATSLMDSGSIQIGSLKLRVIDVYIPETPRFSGDMQFRCLSPVTISTKRELDGRLVTHYCLPDEPELPELVRQNLIRKFEAIYQHSPYDSSFSMEFDQEYISRHEKITRLVKYKDIDIRAILCPFHAKGSKELMFVGYECGFGDKNSAGFGMVEV